MLLVVLGAGASYDSAPSKHPDESTYRNLMGRPPLANQLFADRPDFGNVMNKYPKVLDIAPRLRHLQGELSIETVLQGYQSETLEYPNDSSNSPQFATICKRLYRHALISGSTPVRISSTINHCWTISSGGIGRGTKSALLPSIMTSSSNIRSTAQAFL